MKRICWLMIIGLFVAGVTMEMVHAQAPAAGPAADNDSSFLSAQDS